MSQRYSGKSRKDSSTMKKAKLSPKEKRKEHRIFDRIMLAVFLLVVSIYIVKFLIGFF